MTIEDGTSCVEADLAPEVTAQHFIRVARGVFESWPPARQEAMSKASLLSLSQSFAVYSVD